MFVAVLNGRAIASSQKKLKGLLVPQLPDIQAVQARANKTFQAFPHQFLRYNLAGGWEASVVYSASANAAAPSKDDRSASHGIIASCAF